MALLLQIQRPGWYQGVARACGYSSTMAGGSSSHPLVVVVRSLCNACMHYIAGSVHSNTRPS